jgi:hypothetical protein
MTHPIPPVDSQAALEALEALNRMRAAMYGHDRARVECQFETLRAFINAHRDATVTPPQGGYDAPPVHGEADNLLTALLGYSKGLYGLAVEYKIPAQRIADYVQHFERSIRRLHGIAALSASPRPAEGWRPFATAPQDGTVILAYRPDAGVFTAHYVEEDAHISTYLNPPEGDFYWFSTGGEDLTGDEPTHWMPLPSPPSAGGVSAAAKTAAKPSGANQTSPQKEG